MRADGARPAGYGRAKRRAERSEAPVGARGHPRVNFAISRRGLEPGVQELGIQAENREELRELYSQLQRLDRPVLVE
jgi:hypothetical protein